VLKLGIVLKLFVIGYICQDVLSEVFLIPQEVHHSLFVDSHTFLVCIVQKLLLKSVSVFCIEVFFFTYPCKFLLKVFRCNIVIEVFI